MGEDDEDEGWKWNQVAPRMDINMRGPTVSTHDGKEWVHIDDYRKVKTSLNNYVKQKEWDEESIKELTAQVSQLKERDKWSTPRTHLRIASTSTASSPK